MRIVTWNACRGNTAAKIDAVMRLSPDILLLQEAVPGRMPADAAFAVLGRGLGIATVAHNGYRIAETEHIGSALRTRIEGPESFEVINVWTQAPDYIADGIAVLRAFEDVIARGATVVAGDLNATPAVGKSHPLLAAGMERLNLVSAYHQFHDVAYGGESHPTHYFRWQEGAPFHLDYCYVPRSWAVERVEVGTYAEWVELSDHRPVAVDVRSTPGARS